MSSPTIYAEARARLDAWRAMLPPLNAFATGCLADDCATSFDAPSTVAVGDVLTCPTCGAKTRVIDTGRDPSRVEYLRARPLRPDEVTP